MGVSGIHRARYCRLVLSADSIGRLSLSLVPCCVRSGVLKSASSVALFRLERLQPVQQKVRALVRRVRRPRHHPRQPVRRAVRHPALVHVVAALLRDRAVVRGGRFGESVHAAIHHAPVIDFLFPLPQLIVTGLLMLCFGWRRNRFGYLVRSRLLRRPRPAGRSSSALDFVISSGRELRTRNVRIGRTCSALDGAES